MHTCANSENWTGHLQHTCEQGPRGRDMQAPNMLEGEPEGSCVRKLQIHLPDLVRLPDLLRRAEDERHRGE